MKPLSTKDHRNAPLAWVTERLHWRKETRRETWWTDEAEMQCLGQVHGKSKWRKAKEYDLCLLRSEKRRVSKSQGIPLTSSPFNSVLVSRLSSPTTLVE